MEGLTHLHHWGTQIFGSRDAYQAWLVTPNDNLGGARPEDLLEDVDGLEMVIAELYQLQQILIRLGGGPAPNTG